MALDGSLIARQIRLRAARQPFATLCTLTSGETTLVEMADVEGHALSSEIAARLRSGKSGIEVLDDREIFVEISLPSPRLVLIGAVHISQALAPMAQACGLDVLVVDPRTAFATAERFAGVEVLADWPQDVEERVAFDPFTACAALTHDPKIDDFPLTRALESDCFYVGALGSRRTHAKRVDRLAEAGLQREQLERIHAPIGLDIGAASPAEIAVAVVAEIIASLRMAPSAP